MANARSEDFKSPHCRLSYAQSLFKAREPEGGGAKKFGCTLIFDKADRKLLEEIVAKVIKDRWGPAGIERAKKGLIKSPFLAGDGKEAHSKKTGDLHAGLGPDVFFIRPTANEDRPPRVWWKNTNTPVGEDVAYSGAYGKAVLNAFAWSATSGDGVSFGIQGFQRIAHPKHGDGERLGGSGGIDPEKWNEIIADEGPVPETAKSGGGAASLFGD